MVHDDETVDDLQIAGLNIIQKKKGVKFGLDAVLLADFARIKKNARVCDLGTGSGIIPLLLHEHYSPSHIDAVELLDEYADMASRSVKLNKLEQVITVHNFDIKNINALLKSNDYNAIISNPPYKKFETGLSSTNNDFLTAHHEVHATINDIAKAAAYLLCDHGKVFIVHRPERLCDVIIAFNSYNIPVKRIRFVHSKQYSSPNLVLIEGLKNGRDGLLVLPPLYIYDENGNETEETRRIYRREVK
ncbi:MAG: tRNA1(Val) (adenine(37)-N6)-methyltransferase [Bacillota bacterium]|nr:tRNA1(Val) (adenine(37)-N6)-methyltransferase [Bacillota bacterium]